jgi:hypothetical protein
MRNPAPAFSHLLLIVGIRYFCFVKRQDLTPTITNFLKVFEKVSGFPKASTPTTFPLLMKTAPTWEPTIIVTSFLLDFERMIPGVFDREGQKGERKRRQNRGYRRQNYNKGQGERGRVKGG